MGGEMKMKRLGDLKCVGVGSYRMVERDRGGDGSSGNERNVNGGELADSSAD